MGGGLEEGSVAIAVDGKRKDLQGPRWTFHEKPTQCFHFTVLERKKYYFENREWGGCGGGEGSCPIESEFRVADLEKITSVFRIENSDETGSKSDPQNSSKSPPILKKGPLRLRIEIWLDF